MVTPVRWSGDQRVALIVDDTSDLRRLVEQARDVTGDVEIVVFAATNGDDHDIEVILSRLLEVPDCPAAARLLPATDAVKRVDDRGLVIETVDRTTLWAIDRPVALRRAALTDGQIATIAPA